MSDTPQGSKITIEWKQLASPKGEVREGFWVLDNGVPVNDKACFATLEQAQNWVRSFNWW